MYVCICVYTRPKALHWQRVWCGDKLDLPAAGPRASQHDPVLQCGSVWCSVLQCVAVCCRVVQCVAVWCSVLQCGAV